MRARRPKGAFLVLTPRGGSSPPHVRTGSSQQTRALAAENRHLAPQDIYQHRQPVKVSSPENLTDTGPLTAPKPISTGWRRWGRAEPNGGGQAIVRPNARLRNQNRP